jgi:hypothetical protein
MQAFFNFSLPAVSLAIFRLKITVNKLLYLGKTAPFLEALFLARIQAASHVKGLHLTWLSLTEALFIVGP